MSQDKFAVGDKVVLDVPQDKIDFKVYFEQRYGIGDYFVREIDENEDYFLAGVEHSQLLNLQTPNGIARNVSGAWLEKI